MSYHNVLLDSGQDDEFSLVDVRWLATTTANSSSASNNNTTVPEDGDVEINDAVVLRNTFALYGWCLLVNVLVFCWVRLHFPRAFTVRKWTKKKDLKSPLAKDQFGFFSWIWKMYTEINEDQLLEYCGLDALCFLRALNMGFRLSLVGVFNSIWLMPLYSSAKNEASYANHDVSKDPVVQITISNLPSASPRFLGTVFAAYILIFFTMYTILQEFKWFIGMRKKWLRKPRPHNYTVYVRNVTSEYRSNARLERFFQKCFSANSVLEAHLRVTAVNLSKAISKRAKTIAKFENAVALEEITGVTPTHKAGLLLGGQEVNSIEAYAKEIRELNTDITQRIENIEQKISAEDDVAYFAKSEEFDLEHDALLPPEDKDPFGKGSAYLECESNPGMGERSQSLLSRYDLENTVRSGTSRRSIMDTDDAGDGTVSRNSKLTFSIRSAATEASTLFAKKANVVASTATGVAKSAASTATGVAKSAANTATGVAKTANGIATTAMSMVAGIPDGEYFRGGFVSFRSLSATNAARQLVLHDTPFEMKVLPAPDPKDVFWFNVGRTHEELQLGKLFSMAATAATCVFWTIPTSFFSSLSSVESLTKQYTWMADLVEAFPLVEPMLQLIAPLLLILFNSVLLPSILKVYSMLEGPVSGSVVEASTFSKQSTFMIIQTFFVSVITGGLFEGLKNIAQDPFSAIDLLAETLPAQSTYFMQIAFIRTVIYIANENWRVVALSMAFARKFIGPRLTSKQRNTTFCELRPLSDPLEFELSFNMSQICVLYFVVLLVYQAIAPLTSFVLAFCFRLSRTAYLHQFIYIYPRTRDSGGIIWTGFIKIVLVIMLIAEFTIVGFMTLKKAGISTILMLPLIITTMLFNAYVRQEHFRVTEVLPSKDCLKMDMLNGDDFDLSFVEGAYRQEELREKEAFPDGLSPERAQALGLVPTDKNNMSVVQTSDDDSFGSDESDDDEQEELASRPFFPISCFFQDT